MTIDAVLASLRRAREAARAHGLLQTAEDYDDAMLMLLSRVHVATAEGRAHPFETPSAPGGAAALPC